MTPDVWRGKRVLVTGHTGFKGGWLSLWLSEVGAQVHGFALAPPTDPSFFDVCRVEDRLASHEIGDVRDARALQDTMRRVKPDIVLHLAAQSLVRHSYVEPVETYAVNVMGTVHLLEAVRQVPSVSAVVVVTTDKCYENREWVWPYRECEAMGGHDPYSSSKGCAELVTAAYRSSYFSNGGPRLASARAGNVIGGGDWAADRLLPDFLRAIDRQETLVVRSPLATRPWQHVLEPLSGYVALAEHLVSKGDDVAEAWNFGPDESDARPVEWIVRHLSGMVEGATYRVDAGPKVHEAHHLKLDSSKAKSGLSWHPRWSLDVALSMTVDWHRRWKGGEDMAAISLEQIRRYEGASQSSAEGHRHAKSV